MDALINGLHATCLLGVSEIGAAVSGFNAFGANLEEVLRSLPEGNGHDFRTSKSSAEDRQQKNNPRHIGKTKSNIPGDAPSP